MITCHVLLYGKVAFRATLRTYRTTSFLQLVLEPEAEAGTGGGNGAESESK